MGSAGEPAIARSPVELLAIGIGHDVNDYYQRAVTIGSAEELGSAMIEQLARLFAPQQASAPPARKGETT